MIVIDNTNGEKLLINLNSTELSQDGTPSPDNPVDVNVIKGDNNIVVENKNLFDYHWFDSDKEVVWTINTQLGGKAIPIYIGVGNSATFSSSIPVNTNIRTLYAVNTITETVSGTYFDSQQTRTVQANTSGYVYLGYFPNRPYYSELADNTYYVQIELGSTATEYIEHQEQNYPISLSSKNVFDINDFVTKMSTPYNVTYTDGIVTIKRKGDTTYNYSLSCKENTQYTISLDFLNVASGNYYVRLYYSDNTYTDITSETSYPDFTRLTITSTANKTIDRMNFQLYGYNNEIKMKSIQLEEGTTATTYEPYYNIEYCKIGDYADQIFKNTTDSPYYDNTLVDGDWYCKKNVGKIDSYNGESITTTYISTTGGLDTGATVYYGIATPTYIHITETDYPTLRTQLENLYNNAISYQNETIISQTNEDLPFNFDVSGRIEIKDIEGDIKNVVSDINEFLRINL